MSESIPSGICTPVGNCFKFASVFMGTRCLKKRSSWRTLIIWSALSQLGLLGCADDGIYLLDQLETATTHLPGRSAHDAPYSLNDVASLDVNGEALPAVAAPFPSQLTFEVAVPPTPQLEFSIALTSQQPVVRPRVDFKVFVSEGGESYNVFWKTIHGRQANQWYHGTVNLRPWEGKQVDITLEVRPAYDMSSVPWADRIQTLWGNPVVRTRPLDRTESTSEPPSIIVLMVDTLRYDFLGSSGFRGEISPNLDWLAKESVTFENCFSQAPWTKPSIATLFTSTYPSVHRVTDHGGIFAARSSEVAEPPLASEMLSEQLVTLAEHFSENGYRTAAFVTNPWLAPGYGFEQGFEAYELLDDTKSMLQRSRDWLGTVPQRNPFFLYLHFMDVHAPYNAPETDFQAMLSNPSLRTETDSKPGSFPPYLQGVPWFDSGELDDDGREQTWSELVLWRMSTSKVLRARYAANIRDFDRRIAPFLHQLRQTGLLDRTFLVLTSDHGEELLEHGGWDHGYSLYDHQIKIPLFIRMPNAEKSGRRIESVVSLIDLMPTLASLTGLEVPAGSQGRDFSSLLEGGTPDETFSFSTSVKHRDGVHSVRSNRHKLIFDRNSDSWSLFDILDDPGEYRDIAEQNKPLTDRLRAELRDHLEQLGAQESMEPVLSPIPTELLDRLRALGYLEETKR
jgi:arylsulfatase A-like enzyme